MVLNAIIYVAETGLQYLEEDAAIVCKDECALAAKRVAVRLRLIHQESLHTASQSLPRAV